MRMHEYCIVVVLYKVGVKECSTLRSLLNCKEKLVHSKVVLWDNSPHKATESNLQWLYQEFSRISYIHTPSNTGLSKIYNKVLGDHKHYEYLIIFDQDSHFSMDYFVQLGIARKETNGINLFVPLIEHEGVVVSPGNYFRFKGGYRKKVNYGINSSKNMCIIASGMCIAYRYLLGDFQAFNENFTFYGIDTYFSIKYRKTNDSFYVLPCFFKHSLSVNENEKYEIKLRRFKNHKTSLFLLTADSSITVRILSRIYVFFESLKFRIKHFHSSHEKIS